MIVVLESARTQFVPAVVDRLASVLGVTQAQVRAMLDVILPAEADAMIKRIDTPSKVRDLLNLYAEQRPLANTADMLGTGDAIRTLEESGSPLVSRILGNESDDYRACISQMTGIEESAVWSMMKIAAMILVGALDRKVKADKLDNDQALKLIQDQKAKVAEALPKGLLACVAREQKADETKAAAVPVAAVPVAAVAATKAPEPVKVVEPVRAAPPPPPPPPPPKPSIWRWLAPLLGLLALGALLWFLLRPKPEAAVVVPTATAAPAAAVATNTPMPEPTAAPTEAAEPTAAPTEAPAAEAPVAGAWTCPEGDQTVSIWHGWQGDYFTNIEAIFNEYQTVCPNVKLELLQKPDMNNAVVAAVPAGEGPDIIAWVNDQIGRNAETDIILPLNDYIDMAKFEGAFIPTAVNAMKYAGKTWCYPESMEAITMIYNKDLISEAELPKTTDELLAKAAEWKTANPDSYYFVYNAKNDAYFSAPWWQGAGVTIVDEEGTTTFASDAGYAAGEFINKLRDVMPAEIDYGIADTLFKEGKAPIIMNGPWYIADLDAAGINYGLATLPVFSGTDTPATPFVGVKCLMLTTNATKRGVDAAAVNVMEYYTGKDSQIKLAETNKMVPTSVEAIADPGVMDLSVIAAFGNQAALGIGMPSTPFMGAMWDPIAKGVECIWTGSSDVKTCVDNIQSLAEENIAGMQ